MNSFTFIILTVAIAATSASHIALWGGHGHAINPAAHIPSGSVGVDAHGAVVAGPAGSVRTDNGLHGHGAGAVLSGPSGEIATREGHTVLTGPGGEHNGGVAIAPAYAAPAVFAAPAVLGHSVVAPVVSHAVSHAVVAPAVVPASTVLLTPAVSSVSWGHAGAINTGWTNGGVYAAHGGFGHGLLGHGVLGHGFHGYHHGW